MINRKEVLRYLGYKGQQPEQDILNLIENCVQEVEAAAEAKHVMQRFFVQADSDTIYVKRIQGSTARHNSAVVKKAEDVVLTFHSHSLASNLTGCQEVVVFAATLGLGVDRLLQKYLKIQISKAVVVQAVAAAMIEDYCDQCQAALAAECAGEGLEVSPRYSPGYGDLPLEVQQELLDILDAQKMVGIVLTEGNIMLPEKSVTALMGLRGME